MPPFRASALSVDQTRFNTRLARAHVVIEKCIAALKKTCPSLAEPLAPQDTTEGDITKIQDWISVCAILHNFLREQKETPESRTRVQAAISAARPSTPLAYETGNELRDCLVQAATPMRRPRTSGGVVKAQRTPRRTV